MNEGPFFSKYTPVGADVERDPDYNSGWSAGRVGRPSLEDQAQNREEYLAGYEEGARTRAEVMGP